MSQPNTMDEKERHVSQRRRWLSVLFPPREAARPRRKPPEIDYGVDDVPPPLVLWISALQQAGSAAVSLVIPLVICGEAHVPIRTEFSIISLSMLVLAIAPVLQALRRGPVGFGYLAPANSSAIYVPASIEAVQMGGLPLMFGMTLVAGLFEAGISRVLRRLRPLFPPEIAGLVTFLVGAATGTVGLRSMLAIGATEPVPSAHWIVGALTLATMAGLNVWTKGLVRMSCVLIGIVTGYVAAIATGLLQQTWHTADGPVPLFAFPQLDYLGIAFDRHLLVPFLIAAIAATMKAMAVITTAHRTNDADWVRADMSGISRGVLTDGLITSISGLVGTSGTNISSSSVGLAAATGVTSRRVAFAMAAILAPLAFVPAVAIVFVSMPAGMIGASVLFSSTFVITTGIEMMTSRMLDARRIMIIGAAIVAAQVGEGFPSFVEHLPGWIQPFLATPLVVGTLVALLLNLVFRIGVRQYSQLTVDPGSADSSTIQLFMDGCGAEWGARADVIRRASFALGELVETLARDLDVQKPILLETHFNEFYVVARASYNGALLPLPTHRPSFEEIADSPDGAQRLAGFMIRRHADNVRTGRRGEMSIVDLRFDH
jgi:xanthine permease XanP